MLDDIFVLFLYIVGSYAILRFAYGQWKKADMKEKLARAQEVDQQFQQVSKFEEDHKDLPEKVAKINQFRKKEF
jgi:hypothetical protein